MTASRQKILLMPYGIRLAELDLPLDKAAAKAELGISGFCLGTIGRLEEQKGQEFLLAAVPEISRHIPDLTVLVVGDGRLRSARDQARSLGIQDIVHFLGTRRDLPLCIAPWTLCPAFPLGGPAAGPLESHGRWPAGARDQGQRRRRDYRRRQERPPDSSPPARCPGPAVLELHARPDLWPVWGDRPGRHWAHLFPGGHVDPVALLYEELAA